jgi:hypothetical protein
MRQGLRALRRFFTTTKPPPEDLNEATARRLEEVAELLEALAGPEAGVWKRRQAAKLRARGSGPPGGGPGR